MAYILYSLCAVVAWVAYSMFGRKRLHVQGKHVCITGGSQGLGLSVAKLLAGRGANITIMARTKSKLEAAEAEIEGCRVSESQRFHSVSVDLSNYTETSKAFDEATNLHRGQHVEILISCVGGAPLGLFNDLQPEIFQQAMNTNYYSTLWSVKEASRRMIANKIRGKVVLVSSLVGFFSFAGYSAYSPAKYALRGLADALRNEFRLYGISVHCYFPGTIFSPGLIEENKSRPELTKRIEGPEEGQTPDACAKALIKGLESDHYIITSDILGSIFRNSMRGIAPQNNILVDWFWGVIATVGIPIWRRIADGHVDKYAKEVSYKTAT